MFCFRVRDLERNPVSQKHITKIRMRIECVRKGFDNLHPTRHNCTGLCCINGEWADAGTKMSPKHTRAPFDANAGTVY